MCVKDLFVLIDGLKKRLGLYFKTFPNVSVKKKYKTLVDGEKLTIRKYLILCVGTTVRVQL
jgi:hypothetical protein